MPRTKQIVRIFKRINSFLESSTNMQLKIEKFNLYLRYGDNNRLMKQLTYNGILNDRFGSCPVRPGLSHSLLNVLLQNRITFSLFDHFKDPKAIDYMFFKLSSNERARLNRSDFAKASKHLSGTCSLDELEIKMDLLGI